MFLSTLKFQNDNLQTVTPLLCSVDYCPVRYICRTTEYIGVERWNRVSLSAVSVGVYTGTMYVMVKIEWKGVGVHPHPHQPGLIFPSMDCTYARKRPLPLCVYSVRWTQKILVTRKFDKKIRRQCILKAVFKIQSLVPNISNWLDSYPRYGRNETEKN
jgi:hypothetical protein